MQYKLTLVNTMAGVGCFSAMPGPNLSLNQILDHRREAPMDEFMRQHLLTKLGELRTRKVSQYLDEALADNGRSDPVLAAALYEAVLTHPRLESLRHRLDGLDPAQLAPHTPGVLLRALGLADRAAHQAWIARFAANMADHQPLPTPEEQERDGLAAPVQAADLANVDLPNAVRAEAVRAELDGRLPPPQERKPLRDTIHEAGTVLDKAGCLATPEMAHKACLSPHALLRHWTVDIRMRSGRNRADLFGMQTSYGRGLTLDAARASYLMELAERFSSYVSVDSKGIIQRSEPAPLAKGTYAAMAEQGPALDPGLLRLETPYLGQELWWAQAFDPQGGRVWIPAQLGPLFLNLDEQNLFSGLGSTGLASGNTPAEARLAGLTEVLERDALATIPFDPARLFRMETSDPANPPELAKLLADLDDCSIHPFFMDLTSEFGVPCYKAVVLGRAGDVNQGMGCSLSGARALVSALTEIPYPYPGPATRPVPEGLPLRRLEDLPDLSTGSAQGDLMVIEATLQRNGYQPLYMDLTRKDLGIPVVRAMVPGLELVSDFDSLSRVSPRLWANAQGLLRA